MARVLVAYYSFRGHTQRLAEALAARLGADLEPIADGVDRSGFLGGLRSAIEAVLGTAPRIAAGVHPVRDYELLVVGSPVWVGRPASPVRSFLRRHAGQLPPLALFCTMGGRNSASVFKGMGEAAGVEPLATLAVSDGEIGGPGCETRLDEFAESLRRHLAAPAAEDPPRR